MYRSKKYVRKVLRIRPVFEEESTLIRALTKIVDVLPIVVSTGTRTRGCKRVSLGLGKFESAVAACGKREGVDYY